MTKDFRIDLAGRRLLDSGNQVRVRRKTFDLLIVFVQHEGRLLSQHDLYRAVWGDRHVSDTLLKGCVRELRKALGDDAGHPHFIETVPGHGYRFLGGVLPYRSMSCCPPPWTECLPTVAILPVTCPGGDSDLSELARLATDTVGSEVAQHSRICLIDARQMSLKDWEKHRTRTIGRYLGAQTLVLGRLARQGGRLRLDLQLLHSESGRCLWQTSCAGVDRAGPALIGRICRAAAGQVAFHLQGHAWLRARAAGPTAIAAL